MVGSDSAGFCITMPIKSACDVNSKLASNVQTCFYLIFFYLPWIAPCFSRVYCFSNVYCLIALLLYSLFLAKRFVTSVLERCDINKVFFKRKEINIFRQLFFFFPGSWSGQNNNSADFKSITLFISSAASRCVWSRHTHLNNTDTVEYVPGVMVIVHIQLLYVQG